MLEQWDWSQWVSRMQQAELKLQQLQERASAMQKQLDELQSKPPLHVEYHFDQLKVNRLEGTLNVGVSPQGGSGIESFEIPDPANGVMSLNPAQGDAEAPSAEESRIRQLQQQMHQYMNQSASQALAELEKQQRVQLAPEHRARVVQDVRNQVDERVRYYAATSPYPGTGAEQEQAQWREAICNKTVRDIRGAFANYLTKVQGQQTLQTKES